MTVSFFIQCVLGISGIGSVAGITLLEVDRLSKSIAMVLTAIVMIGGIATAGMIF